MRRLIITVPFLLLFCLPLVGCAGPSQVQPVNFSTTSEADRQLAEEYARDQAVIRSDTNTAILRQDLLEEQIGVTRLEQKLRKEKSSN